MTHTFTRQLLHIVFSTKQRRPLITQDRRKRLYAYIRTVSQDLGVTVLALGGVEDHVHMAVDMPTSISTAEYMSKLKANASRWFRKEFPSADFSWQRGYGAFSLSPSRLSALQEYIDNQQAHHAKQTFQDELRKLVEGHGVAFDERALHE